MLKYTLKTLFWIYIISVFTLVSTRINYAKLPERVKKEMRHKWEACCKENTCFYNSCFIVQWAASSWASVRQRCQSQYPEWPYTVDIFRIRNESDHRTFWTMLQNPINHRREIPKTIWTTGSRCPKASAKGTKLETFWVSINEPFPAWLDEKFEDSSDSVSLSDRCEFLAVSPAKNLNDVKYDFQDQNARHPTICEFSLPGAEWTTVSDSTTQTTINLTTITTITIEVEEPNPNDTISETRETTTTHVTETPTSGYKENKTESNAAASTPSSKIPVPPTDRPGFCKAVNESGIYWPKTEAGKPVKGKCPQGMTGSSEGTCDGKKLEFWPKKPQIEGCKHEWIKNIEDSILKGHDAVDISTRLANETKHNKMSHGDIIALVDVTSRLFSLYVEQKKEEEFEVDQNETLPIYYKFTKTMISTISNILRVDIKDAWEALNKDSQTKEASTILKLVPTIGSRLSCIKKSSEKLQFTVSEENIDLQTFILNNKTESDNIVRFPQETENVTASSFIALPADLKLENIDSPCEKYTSAVGVIYKHVGDFLKTGQQESSNTTVVTKVISFSLNNSTQSIFLSGDKVSITLQHANTDGIRNGTLRNARCVFWNFSKSEFGEWDESGCNRISGNVTHTECQCDHLTNFAVLMDVNNNIGKDEVLTLMTYVCCGFSAISLILTIICFIAIRSLHGRRSIITGNLSFSLLVSNALILFAMDKTRDKVLCAVIAGFLHFWILSAFCWMLVEGYHLYRMVILVFQRGSILPVKLYYLFGYGAPLAVAGISALITNLKYEDAYVGKEYCWLSREDKALIWSFVGPACAVILVNIVVFILTLRSASSVKIKKEQTSLKKIKSWIRGSMSVMCLLGFTWGFGLFYMITELKFFSYIFTIVNGLQGVFIFLFHILLNDKVTSFFSCKENSKYGRKKFVNHTSSNQTHSKTSARTSMNSLGCTSSTRLSDSRNVTNIYSTPISRSTIAPNGKIETSEAGKNNFKKNKLTHVTSNGLKSQTSPYDTNVRIRSASNSGPYAKHPPVLKKLSLTSL